MQNQSGTKLFSSAMMIIFFGATMFTNLSCSNSNAQATLDGKSFTIYIMEGNKPEAESSETLTFSGGMLESDLCFLWGFGKAAYTSKKDGKAIQYDATMTSSTEGTMHWTGSVEGDKLTGDMIWHKEGQDDIHYMYGTDGFTPASLDGKSFSVEMKMGDSTMTETMSFANGNFESPGCYQYGFTATPYKAWLTNGKICFQCLYKSPKEGMMLWNGTLDGNKLNITEMWHKEGQADIYEMYTGTM